MHLDVPNPSLDILRTASQAQAALGPLSKRVARFVYSRQQADGGVMGRANGSDLYYAPFALEILQALGAAVPESLQVYVASFGRGDGLDFMHAACLARCWARLPDHAPPQVDRTVLRDTLLACRCADGGFNTVTKSDSGSVTGCFMALNALCDLGFPELIDPDGVIRCLEGLRTPDGGYGNDHGMRAGTTLAAAGVQTVLHWLGRPTEPHVGKWLMGQMHAEGGFSASPEISLPDLLSTATVLYALRVMDADLKDIHDACETFVDGLMEESGGYCGHWLDDTEDLEYTYYGLMSLGCLQPESGGGADA